MGQIRSPIEYKGVVRDFGKLSKRQLGDFRSGSTLPGAPRRPSRALRQSGPPVGQTRPCPPMDRLAVAREARTDCALAPCSLPPCPPTTGVSFRHSFVLRLPRRNLVKAGHSSCL